MEHPHDWPSNSDAPDLDKLAAALEASWDRSTAYRGVVQPGNPAVGQCYPTSRVVQFFYPETEIACGDVWTGAGTECHFWNVRGSGDEAEWIDLSWQQFPPGSVVQHFKLLDRHRLGDTPPTLERCGLLLRRVLAHLAGQQGPLLPSSGGTEYDLRGRPSG
ncbi:MAG TPA: hypothetical protein VEZ41_02555 [Allosphingosinicella sp.]|nr:hypothetical protein [Allosphingosinicella sp.]